MNLHKLASTLPMLTFAATAFAASPAVNERNPSREWLDIPWDVRYVLFINSDKYMREGMAASKRFNSLDGKQGNNYIYHDIEELFVSIRQVIPTKNRQIAVALISFDRAGRVTNKDPVFSQFIGKLSGIERFVLIQPDQPQTKPYSFAEWDQGIPGDVSFSPALCITIDSHRYDSHWRHNDYRGNVGCREWTAQLYRPEERYIDVTTYAKRGNFIGELVGWARFEDRPRPVIGMQGKQWLCLHECPAGESPGVISNIREWTRKHNFPMPTRPKRQPVYPNANYKDDLNELSGDDIETPCDAQASKASQGMTADDGGSGSVSGARESSQGGGAAAGSGNPTAAPAPPGKLGASFRAVDKRTGEPIAGIPYRMVVSDGRTIRGVTDSDGRTKTVTGNNPEEVDLFWEVEDISDRNECR